MNIKEHKSLIKEYLKNFTEVVRFKICVMCLLKREKAGTHFYIRFIKTYYGDRRYPPV